MEICALSEAFKTALLHCIQNKLSLVCWKGWLHCGVCEVEMGEWGEGKERCICLGRERPMGGRGILEPQLILQNPKKMDH